MPLEEQLATIPYSHTNGVEDIWKENDKKWREAMLRLLVDEKTARSIAGQASECSYYCYNEDGDNSFTGYLFVDTSRFSLSGCPHSTFHVQCVITELYCGYSKTRCPV